MIYAQRCANENAENFRVKHCFLVAGATDRLMGQSIYLGGGPVENVLEFWYNESKDPGYDFEAPGHQSGTGHFTALVWYDTTHVGMARSHCGNFIVANYFPPGNWDGEEYFRLNVLPLKASYAWRPRNSFEESLARQFSHLADKDGMVPKEQLTEVLTKLGEQRLAEAVAAHDLDGDGMIHAGEFVAAACTLKHSDDGNCKALQQTVRRIVGVVAVDENGDGKLQPQELVRYLSSMFSMKFSEKDLADLIKRFDTDGDGCLDYQELMALHDSGLLDKPDDSVLLDRWDVKAESLMKTVPLSDIVSGVKRHLSKGGAARVTKTEGKVIVKLIHEIDGKKRFRTLQGTWEPRRR